ncbi:MAG: membrane dipeptidase [Acidobacteria bacterium]|nr:membrane dipeptidase [Acidobacteriota bacterium]
MHPLVRLGPALLLLTFAISAPAQTPVDEQRFARLMDDILIVDTHIDTPRYILDEGYDFGIENKTRETDIPRLRRGRVGAVFFGMPAPASLAPAHFVESILDQLDTIHEMARHYPDDLEFARTAADIERIHKAGKIAILASIEGGRLMVDDLHILRDYYRLGVLYMTLSHFGTNNWADSSTDVAVHGGLSDFGRDVVREMNRIGMMVDISHVSDETILDTLETTRAPVIASHSSVKAFSNTPRNLSDAMIRAIAANGGVIFINFHAGYLNQRALEVYEKNQSARDRDLAAMWAQHRNDPAGPDLDLAIRARYAKKMPPVSYEAILDHIDHIVKLVGPDHVGFGSDFDGISAMVPEGMEDVSKYPSLIRGMMRKGYSDEDIRKIAGENLLRVMRQCEKVAAESR